MVAVYNFMFEFADSDEGSTRALTSLYRWLREDVAVRGEAEVELVSEPRSGEMGAAEVLCAVLGQVTSVGSLAVAFAAWRDSRSKTPPMRIRLGENSIDVGKATAEQLAMALDALAAMSDDPASGSDDSAASEA